MVRRGPPCFGVESRHSTSSMGPAPGCRSSPVLPFVDATLTAPSSAAASEVGGDGGLGDAVFLAKWRFYRRDRGRGTFRLAVEGGVKAPTGASDLRDTAGQRLPRALQRGSGSWDPTMDLSSTYVPSVAGGRWMFAGDVGYTLTTEADHFELGDRVSYDGMVKYRIHPARYPGRDTFLLVEINGRWQDRAKANGTAVSDSGGHVIYVSPGVQFLLATECHSRGRRAGADTARVQRHAARTGFQRAGRAPLYHCSIGLRSGFSYP